MRSRLAAASAHAAELRRAALRDLADGRVSVVFTVDLFNQGVDVPNVDTLLLLRPTESGTLFLQQLGRGLRRAEGKAVCTVLDFVGHHRREFRYDLRFRALLGRATRTGVERQVKEGFPFLPAGCSADLDPVAQAIVLRSIKESLPSTWRARTAELRSIGDVSLGRFLSESGLDLEDIYANGRSWTQLRQAVGLDVPPAGANDESLLKAAGRLIHVDDPQRIAAYRKLLEVPSPPDLDAMPERDRRVAHMLFGSLSNLPASVSLAEGVRQVWDHPRLRFEMLELLDVLPSQITHLDVDLGLGGAIPLRVSTGKANRLPPCKALPASVTSVTSNGAATSCSSPASTPPHAPTGASVPPATFDTKTTDPSASPGSSTITSQSTSTRPSPPRWHDRYQPRSGVISSPEVNVTDRTALATRSIRRSDLTN